MSYEVIAIGASWGGMSAVGVLLDGLSEEVEPAIVVTLHRGPGSQRGALEGLLQRHASRPVTEPCDKEQLEPRHVYLAPADCYLLVERDHFALSIDERVQYARPSIDVLFESIAAAYQERAIGIVLT